MKVRITIGKGITGAVRYVLGPGHDPKTGRFLPTPEDGSSRVAWVSGTQAFGWKVENAADIDQARREMEFDALNQASKTRKCVFDCVHIVLAWERGETPTKEEMEEACRSQLAAQGMANAKAIFVAHSDEDYFHAHIVASKINPATGRAYDLAGSYRKASVWAEEYERQHGGVVNTNRESANELRRAIKQRDPAAFLEAMTRRKSTFTVKDVERALQKEIHPKIGATADEKRSVNLDRAQFGNAILSQAGVVRLADQRYTTRAVLEAEQHVLHAANGLVADTSHGLDERQRAAILNDAKYSGVSREQALAFRHVTGAEGLAIIDGQAGTGKSYTLAAVREAYEAAGHRVIGLGPTNKVAKNMSQDGFAVAKTAHSELFALNNGRTRWDPKTVVVVDEAAMLDTRLYAMVTAHARDAGAKLILVGDDRQLSSIDRGGMFTALKDRHGAAELAQVRRQYKLDERRAAEMMAEGNFDAALTIYNDKGAITWTRTEREARAELVAKWAADTAATPEKSRQVYAYRNDDVNQLNIELRAVRKQRGELEWQDHELSTAHGRFDFSAGDRIRFTGTDKQAGIINGATGTIEAIDGTHLAVRLDGPEAKTINLDAASFDKFRHSYAGTIHTGQGSTLDQTYLYHAEGWRSAPAYVALTRHREETALFVARNTAEDIKELARQFGRSDETRAASQFQQLDPIGPVRPMNAAEILAQFAGEDFARAADRMEREGRQWPAREPIYRQDNNRRADVLEAGIVESGEAGPRGGDQLDADEITGRVQAIIDDPTREADEQDDRILQALYARREAEAQPATAGDDDVAESTASDQPQETGAQVTYDRWTGEIIGPAGQQPSRPDEQRHAQGGGQSRRR